VALSSEAQLEFTYLRELLALTDGNLGAHLRKLEEAEYIVMEKTFVARKPRSYIKSTLRGRRAFEDHVSALERILKGGGADEENG
jgi:DNA-binding MarR family transcriptional regulator